MLWAVSSSMMLPPREPREILAMYWRPILGAGVVVLMLILAIVWAVVELR
jgi:hypothetical protein